MNTIQVPIQEYEKLKEELSLLKNSELLKKVNRLIDLLYEEKYGLFLHDYTEDLTESSIQTFWDNTTNKWNDV